MQVIIPSMSSTHGDITDPANIIKYVVREYVYTPKNINDTFRDGEISFTYDVSVAEDDKNIMCARVEDSLSIVMNRYFTDAASTDVTATYEDIDDKAYAIKISVTVVVDGNAYGLEGNIITNRDGSVDFNLG